MRVQKYYIKKNSFKIAAKFARRTVDCHSRVAPFSFQTSERCVDDPNCVRLEQPIS